MDDAVGREREGETTTITRLLLSPDAAKFFLFLSFAVGGPRRWEPGLILAADGDLH